MIEVSIWGHKITQHLDEELKTENFPIFDLMFRFGLLSLVTLNLYLL